MSFEDIRNIFHNERWPSDIRLPAWDDLKEKRIPVQEVVFDEVNRCLKSKQIALLLSPASRGKTFLSYAIASHFIECEHEDWLVNYALAPDLKYSEDIAQIESRVSDVRWKSLYIIDDCHDLPNDAARFLRWALRNRQSPCHFLLLTRGLSKEELDMPFSLLLNENSVFLLTPDVAHMKAIVRNYIKCIRDRHPTSRHLTPSDEELEQFIKQKVGTNLDRLMRYLTEAWQPDRQNIGDTDEAIIVNTMWDQYRLDNAERRQLLSVVAALGQFDIGASVSFLEALPSSHRIQELLNEKLIKITKKPGRPRILTLFDPKDSEYILNAITTGLGYDSRQYTIKVLRQYIGSRPPNSIYAFDMLWRNAGKEIIKEVFEDTGAMMALQESLSGRSLNTIDHIAILMEIAHAPLTDCLLSHAGLKHRYQEQARGAPGYVIRHALGTLHGAASKRQFFEPWLASDYLRSINSTRRINTLRYLFYDLKMGDLPDIAEKFADQLPNANLKRLLDPANGESLIDLNHLIGNLRVIPAKLGLFLQKLAMLELGPFIEVARATDIRWFLWQFLIFAYKSAETFVNRHMKVLAAVVVSSELSQALWVLWNTFQASTDTACQIIRLKETVLMEKQIDLTDTPTLGLAWLALLHFCGIRPTDILVIGTKPDQMVTAISNETDPSLSALSLKALTIVLSDRELVAAKTTIDVDVLSRKIGDIPVPQTRRFLQDIINEFRAMDVA